MVTKHRDFDAAKAGDLDAARRLVNDLVKPDRLQELADRFKGAIVVPVEEVESLGTNRIPYALAEAIASRGLKMLSSPIYQTSKFKRRGLDAVGRLKARKVFEGDVISGERYVLVDDILTQGGTIHELRTHIVNNGGEVDAVSSLAFSAGSNIIAIQQDTVDSIISRFGRERTERLLQEHNVTGTIEALTESEGRAIARFKSFDTLRTRLAEEGSTFFSRVNQEALPAHPVRLAPRTTSVLSELTTSLGKLRIRRLTSSGQVTILKTQEEAKAVATGGVVKYSKDGRIQGIFSQGKTYLVEDGIPEGQAMGVLLHELGEHANQLGLAKDAEYQAILSSLEKRAELSGRTGDLIRKAISRIPEDTAPEHKWSEVAAYLVENHANDKISFIDRIVNFFKKWLFKAGGISADTFSEKDLVLFARAAVKAASGVSAREQAMFSIGESVQQAKAFYSKLQQVTGDKFQGMKAQSVEPFLLKQGVKKAEIEATGLREWIASMKPTDKVTKEQLSGFVKSNTVEFEDVVLGESASAREIVDERKRLSAIVDDENVFAAASIDSGGRMDMLLVKRDNGYQWAVDGGETGVGKLFKNIGLAQNSFDEDYPVGGASSPVASWWEAFDGSTYFGQYTETGAVEGSYREMFVTAPGAYSIPSDREMMQETGFMPEEWARMPESRKKVYRDRVNREPWQDGHGQYEDIKNPIVRIRFNEVTGPNGERILRVEEMQGPSASNQEKMPKHLKDNIYQTGVKRILAYAKANGFDGVALATKPGRSAGETQADRYSLERQISKIEAYAVGGNAYNIFADNLEGVRVIEQKNVAESDLPSLVGKDLANKIANQPYQRGEYTDLDLRIGGEGLKQLYDTDLPNIFKAWGGERMGSITVPADVADIDENTDATEMYANMPYIPVTGKTSSTFPMFSVTAAPVTVEEIAEISEPYSQKPDISPVTSIFATAEYTSEKDPAFKRAFEAAMKRGEEKVALGYYILDGVTRDDGPAAFNDKKDSFIKTFDSLPEAQKQEAGGYLRDVDRTGKGFHLKHSDWYTVRTPDGKYVGTARTKEEAYALVRDHHSANKLKGVVFMKDYPISTGKWQVFNGKNKLVQEYDQESDAIAGMMEAEGKHLVEKGVSPEAINAIMMFRAMSNRAFDLQVREWRKIIEECKENGWDQPQVEVIDETKRWAVKDKDGKTVATYENKEEAELFSKSAGRTNKVVKQSDADIRKTIKLEDAIAMIGDLRGTYFPRQRRTGGVTMIAVNEKTGQKFREEFDLYALKGVKPDEETTVTKLKEIIRSAANYGTPMARRMRELQKQGFTVKAVMSTKMPEQVFEAAHLATATSALLDEAMAKTKQQDSKAARQAFETINQAVIMQVADLFKGRGALSSRMKRSEEYWEGFETDPLKAAVQYAKSLAGGVAKRQAAQEMTLAITGRDISWKQWQDENPDGKFEDYMEFVRDRALSPTKQPNLYKEYISWQKEVLRNDEQADRIIGTLRGLATLKYLGLRPAAAVVNLTNFFQAVPATISTDTGRSIRSALAQVNRSLAARHAYNKGKAGDLDANIFAGITERGWDQAHFSHEAAGVLRSKAGNTGAWISDKMMAMFAWSERINRATTIHAAYYELMRSKGIEKPNAEQHQQLMNAAHEISNRAHGIYGKETAPVWTRGQFNPLRLTWTFAKFSQNYMLNMGRMVGKGDYKNAAWMLLSPGVLGGAGASLATPVIVGLMKAFGIGGDDPEEELYKWVESQLGSDSLARHGLPGLVGVNFKGSLSANIPFPTTLSEIFGAPGSVITDVKESFTHAGRGEFLKAGEKLLPSAFTGPIKAYRESTEGITTGTYSPVYHGKEQLKADPWDAFLRASSFNPSRLSGIREKQWKEKNRAKSYLEERTEINSMIKKAWINGGYRLSRADLAKIKVYIDDYNDRVKNLKLPGVSPITNKSIALLLKRNAKASKFELERE